MPRNEGKRKDLRENGQVARRGGERRVGEEAGRRVDTFEEGSVDAVAPASQWLLRHSSARGRALSLRGVFGPDVRDHSREKSPPEDMTKNSPRSTRDGLAGSIAVVAGRSSHFPFPAVRGSGLSTVIRVTFE